MPSPGGEGAPVLTLGRMRWRFPPLTGIIQAAGGDTSSVTALAGDALCQLPLKGKPRHYTYPLHLCRDPHACSFLRLRAEPRMVAAPTKEVRHRPDQRPRWDMSPVFGLVLVLLKMTSYSIGPVMLPKL